MEVGETFQKLCNPGIPISYPAMGVHHITEEMIQSAQHPQDYLDQLEDGANYMVAHNLDFEAKFMDFTLPTICTLKCARQIWPEAPDHKNQTLKYWLGLHTEIDAARAFPAHAAGPDTYVTAHILKRLLIASAKQGGDFVKRLVDLTNTDPNKDSDGILIRCEFGKNRGETWENLARHNPGFLKYCLASDRCEPDVRKTCNHYVRKYNIR